MTSVVHPHGPLRELAPGLHVAEGTYGHSPMGRRMSVIVTDGGLFIHAPMRLRDEEQDRLDALEPVLALEPERIVVSHGSVLESGGAQALHDAFAFLGVP